MDLQFKDRFLSLWDKYFEGAELPITFYYSSSDNGTEPVKEPSGHVCMIGTLKRVRKGESISFNTNSLGCSGARRYLGYKRELAPDFRFFLSCGIPGGMEGERYKKTPEIVDEILKNSPDFKAPADYIIFKRWDKLDESDDPDVVIFYASPDVLSGLFTLAGFDETEKSSVYSPFAAGCGSIVLYPYLEIKSDRPKCIIGMFDVSARPYVPQGVLSFSAPINRFRTMVENMDESFLITPSWEKVRKRINKAEC
jgi:uncharacterized protein (DUF169 family)